MAPGGKTSDILVKSSDQDYDSEWTDEPIVDKLRFDLTAAEVIGNGEIGWNADEGTLELGKGGISNYIGQETMVLCRNNSNTVTIPKGAAVRFAGAVGNSGRIKVAPMVADGTLPGYVFFGVTDQAIAGGGDGYVTVFGKIRGINTNSYIDGDILWCDPANPGGFTKIEPQAPNLKLAVAAVLSAANNGAIFVRWDTGRRLQDLHDVEANGGKQNGDILTWDAGNNRWEAKPVSNGNLPAIGNPGDLLTVVGSGVAWTSEPSVDSLQFDITASGVTATGQLRWNAAEGTVDVGLLDGTVSQLGQEVQLLCKNSATSLTIANGAGVMFTGSDPTTLRLEVQPMDASGSLPGYVFFGVATQTIAPSGEGYITTFGKVRNIDTSAYPEDTILWCDPVNPGQFVTTEPEAPNLKIAAATVVKSHPTSGVIMVRADTGQNLSDCHDVEVATAQDTDYLGWSEDMQHWMPFPVKNDAPKSITISEPLAGDSFTLFRTTKSTTLDSVVGLVVGSGSPSLSYQLRYASDRTASGTAATPVTFINNTTSGAPATIQNMPVPSGNYVWLNITAVSGTTSEFNLSVGF
jgi:hypothetical protein